MKKVVNMILALSMIATVTMFGTACSSNDNAPKKDAASNDAAQNDSTQNTTDTKKNVKIGVLQLVEHDALDKTRMGFFDALTAGGYEEGSNLTIDIQNAQNDQSNLKTMSQKFVNDKVDLIFAIATPSAQSAATETTEIPIVGSAITDYVDAGLVQSNDAPGANITGTSDKTPVDEQFQLLKKLLPDMKTVGIMYNSSEVNSEVQAELAKKAADSLGIAYELGTVTSVNDIPQVTQSLVGKVDALYIPTDNTFASAMPLVASVAEQAKLPVIPGEIGMCAAGGLATVGIDYYQLGEQTGEMAIRILEGADIKTTPVEFTQSANICINLDTAKTIGFEVPQEILDSAVVIVENGTTVTK